MVVPPNGAAIAAPRDSPTPSASAPTSISAAAKSKISAQQSAPGTLNGPPSGNNHAIPLSARRAEPLDMKLVERRGHDLPPEQRKSRPFDIPNAPIFTPSEEEFKDPMEYMRKIAPEGSKYGIVKIVPPETWNPPFAINTERFHFRTRRQELNSVEGGNRVNNDYLDQLAKFHKTHGHSLNRFPSVDKRPLDLYRLKKTVERKGGFDAVCKGKRWAEVGRDLGYSGKIMSSLSTSLKNSYQKWLLPYEDYLRQAKPGVQQQLEMMNGGPFTPSPGPSPAKKSQNTTPLVVKEETPAMKASSILNANLNGHDSPSQPAATPAPPTNGFTAVNATSGFTAVNAPTPPSFTAVNGTHRPVSPQAQGTPPPTSLPAVSSVGIAPNPTGSLKRQISDGVLSSDELDALGRRSKRLKRDAPTVVGSNMHHSRMVAARYGGKDRPSFRPGEACEGCGRSDDIPKRVTCDSCESTFHMYCLEPPLKQRPEFEWHCPKCLVGTNEYGFEEGDVYSLSGFRMKAEEFKKNHFSRIPKQFNPLSDTKQDPTEDDVEKEFWRLVEDMNDTVEVEYGADIHSTTHGSGFPTIEKQPREPYSMDPWNLNILPLDKESLFRHIKSDISGMTVPWLYVGMVFSTFCWHNEDHFSYSANYQHFGATKTWYGIPGEDSAKFELAMREEVPELFEMQPDLLFQLVTLAKPEKLHKAGVKVYAIDQHAGEFVITYPRAYHAGFNHGFNFNEAVNFAPADWEPFGAEGVKRLRDYRKQPCFSHDELLLTAASGQYSIVTAKWLAPALERLREDEVYARRYFFGKNDNDAMSMEDSYSGPRYQKEPQIDAETEVDAEQEEEVICTFCKSYCYLSRLACIKTGKSVCLLHAGNFECCDATEQERYTGENGEHVLHYRLSDAQIDIVLQKALDRASIPETWTAKVDQELDDNPRPSLRHLRTLLAEGEKIQYDLPQLPDLKRFVERCNEWVEEATAYITRKQQNRRKNEKLWRKNSVKSLELDEQRDKELRSVEKIRKLLEAADNISFQCPEITTLQERADNIAEFQRNANAALRDVQGRPLHEFEELVEVGREFHVDIPEIDQLEQLVKRLRWNDMARQKRPTLDNPRQESSLAAIDEFIKEGLAIGVPEDNPDIVYFMDQKAQGEAWEQKAQELMSVEQVHFQQLDALSRRAATIPVSPDTLARVDAFLKKQRELQDKVVALFEQTRNPDFRQRPRYEEVRDLVASFHDLQSKPAGSVDLEREVKRHEDWMRRGKKLFGKANAPLHILKQHMAIVEARNEGCFDLRDKPRMPVEPSSRANTPDENGDRITEGESARDVFCICRRPEAGMMIECELCHEWYHGKCLKIARGKVKEDDKYTCPICDWRIKIPRDAARPRLEDLQLWQEDLENLPFQPDEEDTLNNIVNHGQAFRDFLQPYVNPANPVTSEEVATLRFYLRKTEGADILLAHETNYLRQELHKWAPVTPTAPDMIQISASTRKPRPTKQQKIMAQLGITNPDELPQEYRIKSSLKRKASDALSKTMPLQPAGDNSPTGSAQPLAARKAAPKHGLTALAIQVLGTLAGNPTALKMLAAEPHMNREKLQKMKVLLTKEPDTTDDVESFTAKMAALPHQQPFNYEPNKAQPKSITPSPFPDQRVFTASRSPSGQQHRLGSPAQFSATSQFKNSPASPHFGGGMFENPAGTGMFESPNDKPSLTSPDFANSRSLFHSHSPRAENDGLRSPGFGDSQINPMDNVFADLVNDQEGSSQLDAGIDPELTGEKAKEESTKQSAPAIDESVIDPSIMGETNAEEGKGDVVMSGA